MGEGIGDNNPFVEDEDESGGVIDRFTMEEMVMYGMHEDQGACQFNRG